MLIALYKPNKLQLCAAEALRKLGLSLYEWEANEISLKGRVITFPDSSQYVALMEESRSDLHKFFSEKFKSTFHKFTDTYFRKKYDIQYLDYYAFRKQLNILLEHKHEKCIIIGGGYNKNIFEKEIGSFFNYLFVPISLFCGYWILFHYASKAYASTIFFKGDVVPGDVLYLRKKVYPDLGMKNKLSRYLNQKKINCTGAFALYGPNPEKYDFNFLNGFRAASNNVCTSFFSGLSEIPSITLVKGKNSLFLGDVKEYIKNSFLARSIVALECKVIVGVLVDKPMFVLLSQYKSQYQKIMALNESFFYAPFRSFDYNILDVYFSLNELDSELQNKYGGHIGEIVPVEFIRKSLVSTSKGVSEGLRELITVYKKVAVATTMQVSETGFTQWSRIEVNKFVDAVIDSAIQNPSDLFILKGKKNELSYLSGEVLNRLNEQNNIFTIQSTKPRNLKFDQFEDLLQIANIVISMSHTSTTIWQAVAENIPVIAINDAHPPSFLADYELVEVNSENMASAYNAWFDLDAKARAGKLNELSGRVNIGESGGLSQIAEYITKSLSR